MDKDLIQALKQLKPVAQGLVALANQGEALAELGDRLAEKHQAIVEAQEEYEEVKVLAAQAKEMIERAKGEVIQAKAQAEQIIEAARQEGLRIVAQAKKDADIEVADIRDRFKSVAAGLAAANDKAKADLDTLRAKIAADTKTHDLVLSSIESLQRRLGSRSGDA